MFTHVIFGQTAFTTLQTVTASCANIWL